MHNEKPSHLTRKIPLRLVLAMSVALAIAAVVPRAGAQEASSSPATAATPTFQVTPAQNGAVILRMSSRTPGAAVHYTIDGSVPDGTSPIDQAPMLISSRLRITAIATAPGLAPSAAATWTPTAAIKPGALAWSDEFSNSMGQNAPPDSAVWTYDTGNNGWGNSELENYCAWDSLLRPCDPGRPNAYVGVDGNLHIAARQPFSGVYTSARVKSQGLLSILYGRAEARIRVPEAQGFWPAFWMLGNNIATDNWPACGELDIQERVNAASNPDWNEGSVHGKGFTGTNLGTRYNFPSGETAAGWHTYGVIWKPGSVQYYIDNPTNIYATYTPASVQSLPGAVWPFDSGNAQFFIINLAVGGDWPGSPTPSTPFPAEILVDYVRVYAAGN